MKQKGIYSKPEQIVFAEITEEFICTSGDADSERNDYFPEDWD